MGVLVFFALIGAFASIFAIGCAGLFLWLWWAEKIINKPKSLKELKKQWQAVAVEDR